MFYIVDVYSTPYKYFSVVENALLKNVVFIL